MNLKNKVWRQPEGKGLHFLCGKQIDEKRSIYLVIPLNDEDGKHSLLNVEFKEGDGFDIWPYKGADSDEIMLELLEEYLATAFDDVVYAK